MEKPSESHFQQTQNVIEEPSIIDKQAVESNIVSKESDVLHLASMIQSLIETDTEHITPSIQLNREFLNVVNFILYLQMNNIDDSSMYNAFKQFSQTAKYFPPLSSSALSIDDLVDSITKEPQSKRRKIQSRDRVPLTHNHLLLCQYHSIFSLSKPIMPSTTQSAQIRSMMDSMYSVFDLRVLHMAIESSYIIPMYSLNIVLIVGIHLIV